MIGKAGQSPAPYRSFFTLGTKTFLFRGLTLNQIGVPSNVNASLTWFSRNLDTRSAASRPYP